MSAEVQTFRRRNYGNGHAYYEGDRKVDGVTTLVGDGVPKPKMQSGNWAAERAAKYALDHWDDLLEMAPSERLEAMRWAHKTSREEAAKRGTLIHALVARLTGGDELEVPEEFVGHADSWLAFDREWKPEPLLVEVTVGSRRHNYAGTLDLVARLADGHVWLLDYKTGLKGVWPETALQLSAYRYAEFYVDGSAGEERPMLKVDRTGAIELRSDGYRLLPVRADEDIFEAFLYAQQVAFFVRTGQYLIGSELPPPEEVPA